MATDAVHSPSLVGFEVPIIGSDKIQWIDITVPSQSSSTPTPPSAAAIAARNAAGSELIGGSYIVWKIHESLPNVLEIVEFSAYKEFPQFGLRLLFQDALCPFAFFCKNEISNGPGNALSLYAVSVSGMAYLINLRSPVSYSSGSTFVQSELVEVNISSHAHSTRITAVVASRGYLVVGYEDGSLFYYKLGLMDPSSSGFKCELRDDIVGRFLNMVSRGKTIGAVQDMLISEISGKKLLFVLHLDGNLRIWDLLSRKRVESQNICLDEVKGKPLRLWADVPNYNTKIITLAVLHGGTLLSDAKVIAVYHFNLCGDGDIALSQYPSIPQINLTEEKLIDLKFSFGKLWVLKERGVMVFELSKSNLKMEHTFFYYTQEDYIADQFFQNSAEALDDLVWSSNSLFTSKTDEAAYFVSSIFLRRLLQPGVYHSASLRAALLEHKKHFSDHEFHSLTMTGLQKEIFAMIASEGTSMDSSATVRYWKTFCSHFLLHWSQNSTPYGLLVDPSRDVVGLIRKNSLSLFRSLAEVEQLSCGFSLEKSMIKSASMIISDNGADFEILFEVIRCMNHISRHLGKYATAIYYESLISQIMTPDDIVLQLMKIFESGYHPFSVASLVHAVGIDATWEKQQAAHKSQRKFSAEMLLSLNILWSRNNKWEDTLNVLEKYIEFLNPCSSYQKLELQSVNNINTFILVEATSQVAMVMFETSFTLLLLLEYLVNLSGQVYLLQDDVVRIRGKLIPIIHEVIIKWLIIHFVGTTPTAQPIVDDFSSQLSSLNLGNRNGGRLSDGKLGSPDFPLASLLGFPMSLKGKEFIYSAFLPSPITLNSSIKEFCSLIIPDHDDLESTFLSCSELASLLLYQGQFEATENLLVMLERYSRRRKVTLGARVEEHDSCARLHLLGYCLLVLANSGFHGVKQQKIQESIRCFFRAASGDGAPQSLSSISFQTGFQPPGEHVSPAVWKLHYLQWAMQIFEQYGISEGACQFAVAALGQVDEVLRLNSNYNDDQLPESSISIQGRLWANIFKFTLDLNYYEDAYCAIISNPDEDSKYICLRRFINVLCEHGSLKVLCSGNLPYVSFVDKVEQELFWKAEHSDISSKPNIYKFLYAFEACRSNWRKAASYMYRYSVRLKNEAVLDSKTQITLILQERMQALSTAINSLQLVDHGQAWIDSQFGDTYSYEQGPASKRPRDTSVDNSTNGVAVSTALHCIDVEMLEKEYLLILSKHMLSVVNDDFKLSGYQSLESIVDALIQENLYDMAFTLIIKFWKGSELLRELERAFISICQNCCSDHIGSSFEGSNVKTRNLFLTFSENESGLDGINVSKPLVSQSTGNGQWDKLEHYLEKYRKLHPRLQVTVAEALLYSDPQIELPLWLVSMFKGKSGGKSSHDSDVATLLRLFVQYGRHVEATNLLVEYLESFSSMKPIDVINRKKMSAIWTPYTTIKRLWCQLEECRKSGYMVEQCNELEQMLQEALRNHLKMIEIDSQDAFASSKVSV